ncbi:MAG TPA: Hsp20/alpha crystallin family protein [Bacilli bacterium]|nr:Hsp20/alpha crystallin family protein [Bacilli bacterium]
MKKNYAVSNIVNDSFDLWDPFFEDFFDFPREIRRNELMKADVREDEKQYHIDVDLPSIKKENIKIELKDGYLTIHAEEYRNSDETKSGKYIRRERFAGKFSRSFYVGEDVEDSDITANLSDGVLTLDINKVEAKKIEKKYIEIK